MGSGEFDRVNQSNGLTVDLEVPLHRLYQYDEPFVGQKTKNNNLSNR